MQCSMCMAEICLPIVPEIMYALELATSIGDRVPER